MQQKNNRVQARIEPELKQAAETIFNQLGITSGEAIRMFYAQVKLRGGIPFDVAIPNHETQNAMQEAQQPGKLEKYPSFAELRKKSVCRSCTQLLQPPGSKAI